MSLLTDCAAVTSCVARTDAAGTGTVTLIFTNITAAAVTYCLVLDAVGTSPVSTVLLDVTIN